MPNFIKLADKLDNIYSQNEHKWERTGKLMEGHNDTVLREWRCPVCGAHTMVVDGSKPNPIFQNYPCVKGKHGPIY